MLETRDRQTSTVASSARCASIAFPSARMRIVTMPAFAVVPTEGMRERSMSSPRISASELSPSPTVCSAAVSTTAPSTAIFGATSASNIGCISRGGPGRQKTQSGADDHVAIPGAVPLGFASNDVPGGRSACLRLSGGITRPFSSNHLRRCAIPAGSSSSGARGSPDASAIASANASRVRSSSVGPSPPVTTTAECVRESSTIARAILA